MTYQGPEWHVRDLAASTTHSEGEHEDHDLSSSVQSGREEEVVLPEPSRAVLPQIVLREDCKAECRKHGAVDSDAQISKGPYKRDINLCRLKYGKVTYSTTRG